ncbi:MAG: iron ABC transporter substrate-binding protein, partial [Pseudomonadota bacterium]|nr:iron ABC transporter substrate-binding protein [Pseudomonadota bacterium]
MTALKGILAASALAGVSIFSVQPAMADGEVNIYSYRQPDLIKPLLDEFTKETGVATNVLFLDKGLVERIQAEGANSPADVILTVDIARVME